ncbi:hypothetical protein V500_03867 [Pseudogymnoascus sp. VKM F-4518 (FW-2643)]|nr:hypothetical protein V500_03867 [Pseudogymnoascus sp. VKM F-4518 (FW-2643)]
MSASPELYTTLADFVMTKKFLTDTRGQTWVTPVMKSTANMNLGADQQQPKYRALKQFIDANEPLTATPNPQLRSEPESIDLPHYSLQLAKAAEFLYHEVDDATVISCLPRTSKGIDNVDFQTAMKGHHTMIRYFKSMITADMSYFVLSEQWKAIDFQFVHHEGIRASAEEEAIRQDMRRITTYGIAILMADLYRYTIQQKASNVSPTPDPTQDGGPQEASVVPDDSVPDDSAGIAAVRENYKCFTCWGPTAKVIRTFGILPAAAGFERRRNAKKPKIKSFNGGSWTESD